MDYEVAGCLGCDSCQEDARGFGCLQNDDFEEILDQIRESDLVVYAAPGLLLERAGPVQGAHRPPLLHGQVAGRARWQARLLNGKRSALLLTCGGDAGQQR